VEVAWEGGSDSNLDTTAPWPWPLAGPRRHRPQGPTCIAGDVTDKGFDDFHFFLSKQFL
jgi:hypothetical protein